MYRYLLFYLYALPLALCIASTAIAAPQKHNFTEQQCRHCHLSDPAGEGQLFTAAINTLCRGCHSLLETNVHPSMVKPGMTMPPGFWLDREGMLNCATCHDPHPEQTADSPLMLRGGADGLDFCALCHDTDRPHRGATFLAHSKSYTAPNGSPTGLDGVSRDCLRCHDPSDPHSGVCIIGQKGQCAGHIAGLNYDEAAGRNRGLTPRSSLSPLISLYEGKIGCASCHSIYSKEPAMLVFSNQGSALCFACHGK